MQPELKCVEVETVATRDHDLAIEDAPRRQSREQYIVQLWEVAIQRTEIAALNEDVGVVAKHDRAESIPLRFVEVAAAGGQLLCELCEHRLDWWCRGRGGFALRGARGHFV